MKKRYFHLLCFIILGAIASACGDSWLDTAPADGVDSEKAITNYNDLQTARTGMYDGLQGNSTYTHYYAARMFYYGDVRGDDMQARVSGNRSSACYEMKYTADNAPNMWNILYNVIRRANRIIEAIDNGKVTDATAAQLGSIYGEALTVRALVHFDLVRIYANPYTMDNGASLGIPLMLSITTENDLLGRDTVARVYSAIITDLTNAINSGYMATAKTTGYLNVWSAKALLTRVYLYKGENNEVLTLANDIISNSPYKLWENEEYVDAWYKDNGAHTNEMIFEILNHSSDDWTDREGIAYLYNENGYADAIVTKSFTNMLSSDTNDIRNKMVLAAASDEDLIKAYGDNKIFINKFPADPITGEMRLNNLPLLRISEVYLNAAEAAVKASQPDDAIKYLNPIILRANPNATEVSSGEATLNRVILERRKELVGEGHRFFDAMRNDETIIRYTDVNDRGHHYILIDDSKTFDRTYFRTILPIPVSETDVNPTLKSQQNPNY